MQLTVEEGPGDVEDVRPLLLAELLRKDATPELVDHIRDREDDSCADGDEAKEEPEKPRPRLLTDSPENRVSAVGHFPHQSDEPDDDAEIDDHHRGNEGDERKLRADDRAIDDIGVALALRQLETHGLPDVVGAHADRHGNEGEAGAEDDHAECAHVHPDEVADGGRLPRQMRDPDLTEQLVTESVALHPHRIFRKRKGLFQCPLLGCNCCSLLYSMNAAHCQSVAHVAC